MSGIRNLAEIGHLRSPGRAHAWAPVSRRNARALLTGLLWAICALMLSRYLLAIPEGVSIATWLLFLIVAGGLVARRQGKTPLNIFLIVFPVAVLGTLFLYTIYLERYGTPYYVGGSDDVAFEKAGRAVADALGVLEYGRIRGEIVKSTHNAVGYVYFVSLLIRVSDHLGGFHTLIPRFVNAAALALLASSTYVCGIRCRLAHRTAVAAALLTGIAPVMVYTAVHTFRDTLTSLITMAVVLEWVGEPPAPGRAHAARRIGVTALGAIALSELRQFQAVATLGIVLVALVAATGVGRGRAVIGRRLSRLVLSIGGLAATGFALSPPGRQLILRLGSSLERYTDYRLGMADGLSRFVFGAPFPWTYALRALYALVTPFPVLTGDIDRLWLSVGTILQWLLLPFVLLGLRAALRQRRWWTVVSALIFMFSGMALVSFTSRHIAQFLPYAALVGGLGYERSRSSRAFLVLGSAGCGLLLGLVYVCLKLG